ncbi:quaternary amine ABC transporter ATP-binding protein [Candidatus Entotheonella palauensis]|uniref:Glycine/betaine ABC transporter n=1 Tax=Candidatus Entotheonella gemina TaxID=1429439 RepID=W4MAI1_9BACT|nr:glycine betaine/L-proline ABC transporter ATP-binding protein [Candidatus Entotheonella palauensis]ETX06647.1 MAG: glycine/betaine ABC transporter [Candidatus Entotheonella gemina]
MRSDKIVVRQLYKIFGNAPEQALARVKSGVSKQELLTEYNHVLGLSDINLSIAEQEIFVVMGLSGSGKSTLIRHLNRLIDPTAGEVVVDGQDIVSLSRKDLEVFRREKMSMVFQRFGLMPHRTVLQNVGYGLAIQGMHKTKVTDRAMQWIEQVGLEGYEAHYPGQLSGGMQQRVGLARALATDAEILLMDEAFSALDPLIRTSMQDLLLELQAKLSKTIVFITHDLDEALRLADSLVILKDGFVVQAGDPQEIVMHPADEYIENFVKDINRSRVIRARSVMQPVCDDDVLGVQVDADDNLETVLNALQGDTGGCVGVVHEGETVGMINVQTLLDVLQSPQR